MFSFYEFEAKQQHAERLRAAETNRNIHLAQMSRGNTRTARGRAMVWLGNRLVASGRKLQMSYR